MPAVTQREFATQVVVILQSAGFEALWAGGCVRDQLLNREPKDYDVATSATPEKVRELFGHNKTLAIGAAFGVITVLGPKSAGQIEVATFRTDGGYSDGRHPDSVRFSTAEEDARRRDFTINGLFYDPISQQIIDYVGGQQDLKQNYLRAIGDPHERIAEDKLRMLRAVRFAATFNLEIDPATLAAIQQRHKEISVVSQERVGAELRKMLGNPSRHLAYEWLIKSCLFDEVIPCVPVVNGYQSILRWPNQCAPTLQQLPENADHCLAMAALLSCYCHLEPVVASVCRTMKWSNKETEKTVWIWKHIDDLATADKEPWSKIQPLLINEWAEEAIILGQVLVNVLDRPVSGIELCRRKLRLPLTELNPAPFLDGRALQQLKISSGPIFKEILERTRAAQLDGEINCKEEAIAMAKAISKESQI